MFWFWLTIMGVAALIIALVKEKRVQHPPGRIPRRQNPWIRGPRSAYECPECTRNCELDPNPPRNMQPNSQLWLCSNCGLGFEVPYSSSERTKKVMLDMNMQ
jgi:hypothetical protein